MELHFAEELIELAFELLQRVAHTALPIFRNVSA